MKNFMKLSALVTAMAASAGVSAADVKLGVTGRIVPPACTVALANGGTVSYGTMSADVLDEDKATQLPSGWLETTIACAADARFALQFIDNQAGTSNDDVADVAIGASHDQDSTRLFGMGLDGSGNKIGGYYIRFNVDAKDADGTRLATAVSQNGGGVWTGTTSITPTTGRAGWHPRFDPAGTAPIALTGVTANLGIYPGAASSTDLDLTSRLAFRGDVSIVLHYL